MADLLTHSLVNYVVGASSGRLRAGEVSWLVSGGLLPDLLSRVPTMALEALPLPQSLSQSLCGVFEGGELFRKEADALEKRRRMRDSAFEEGFRWKTVAFAEKYLEDV